MSITELAKLCYQYRPFVILLAVLSLVGIVAVLAVGILKAQQQNKKAKEILKSEERLLTTDFTESSIFNMHYSLANLIMPDGAEPYSMREVQFDNGGQPKYVRCFTVLSLPNTVVFAQSFQKLMDFENMTSVVFASINKKALDELKKETTIQDGERISAIKTDDMNRLRKTTNDLQDTEKWAAELESGDNTLFEAGFLFAIVADTLEDLESRSQRFRQEANTAGFRLTACYGVHLEAYLSAAPGAKIHFFDNTYGRFISKTVKMLRVDQYALSTIYNYRSSNYIQKDGIYLGENMLNGSPVFFNLWNRSRNGYCMLFAGPTGVGKSLAVKIMAYRMAHNTRFVSIDSQMPKGFSEGEYCAICRKLAGTVFRLSSSSDEVLNPWHVESSMIVIRDKDGNYQEEHPTLELKNSISRISNSIMRILTETGAMAKADIRYDQAAYMEECVNDINNELFAERHIVEGDADSLYEIRTGISGIETRQRKSLPTMTDFFKKLVEKTAQESDEVKKRVYDAMQAILKRYVREVYYTKSGRFISREEYETLPEVDGKKYLTVTKYETGTQIREEVFRNIGTSPYFDGQSTLRMKGTVRWLNIDVSGLPENEIPLARAFAINYSNEAVVKKNSEESSKADRVCVIYDEVHKMLPSEYERRLIDSQVREVRKRNASVILLTQSIMDFEPYPEGRSIIDNCEVSVLFKHPNSAQDYIQKVLGLTDSQVMSIVDLNGNPEDGSASRKGECCIVDHKEPHFVRFHYLKEHEADFAETTVENIIERDKQTKSSAARAR